MYSVADMCTLTTRLCRYWIPVADAPEPAIYGPMFVMSAVGEVSSRLQFGLSMPRVAVESIPASICVVTKGSCTAMDTRA